MLTKQALLDNLRKRHTLLCKLYLSGYIKNSLFIRYLMRFNKQTNSNTSYAYLQKWESRLERIENQV